MIFESYTSQFYYLVRVLPWHVMAEHSKMSTTVGFLWADSQNITIFICSSHIWNLGQTKSNDFFYKYIWLQLQFACYFFTKKVRKPHVLNKNWEVSICDYDVIIRYWIHIKYNIMGMSWFTEYYIREFGYYIREY